MRSVVLLHAALLIVSATAARLVVLPAGLFKTTEKHSKTLNSNDRVCPNDYPKGFAIDCRGGMVGPVKFFVDGNEVRKVSTWPYTLNGHRKGTRYPYKGYKLGATMVIKCQSSSNGPTKSARITFSCTKTKKVKNIVRKATPKKSNAFTKHANSNTRKHNNWRWPGGSGCVVVNASNPINALTKGWSREKNGDGLTFRAGDPFEGIVRQGTSPLHYEFQVPRKSTYAITVDMTTRGWTEHNDIFIQFKHGKGLKLFKPPGSTYEPGHAYTKAYHNHFGRAKEVRSVDGSGHFFSTISELRPGEKYVITIGARSTKVTVHNIVLFPCRRWNCNAYDKHWKRTLPTCGI